MPTTDLCLLVIAADGAEPALTAIRQSLDHIGTPYRVHIAGGNPGALNEDSLSSGEHAFYQGVILTTGSLGYHSEDRWISALSDDEWHDLRVFEARFGIRELSWYTYPTAGHGFREPVGVVDTSTEVLWAQFTPAGRSLFSYINTSHPLPIRAVTTYLARPDGRAVPLLQDSAGNSLAIVRSDADGTQSMLLTFDSNHSTMHSTVLAYGLVHWVTKGLFVGDRRTYLSLQVDDMFVANRVREAHVPCGAPVEASGRTFRISAADMRSVASWQESRRADRVSADLRVAFAFTGEGTQSSDADADGALIPEVIRLQHQFHWISHTYDHTDMDRMDYAQARREIEWNVRVRERLGLNRFSALSLVTPAMSGLDNAAALQAAYDAGIRYLVCDSSKQGENATGWTVGVAGPDQASIAVIPRRPTNLFSDVTTPAEWVAAYNCRYSPEGGPDLTYAEILDRESELIVGYMVRGDLEPLMFHQANLRAYEPDRSLLTDLIDAVLAKYRQLLSLPVVCPTMDELGRRLVERRQWKDAGVVARVVPGEYVLVSTQRAATVPVTGLALPGAEWYVGHPVSRVRLQGNQSAMFPLQ